LVESDVLEKKKENVSEPKNLMPKGTKHSVYAFSKSGLDQQPKLSSGIHGAYYHSEPQLGVLEQKPLALGKKNFVNSHKGYQGREEC